jgi:hypothetical protein
MKEVARNVGRRYNLTTHRQSWHRDDVPASRPVPTPPISSRPCIDPSIASGRSPFPSRRPTKHLVSVHRRRSRCLVSPLLVSSHPIQHGTYYTDTTAHARSVGSGRSARRYVIRVASCPVAGQPRVHMYIAASSTTKLCFAAGAVSSSPASVLLHTSSRPARRQENPARWIPQRERWVAGALARRKQTKVKRFAHLWVKSRRGAWVGSPEWSFLVGASCPVAYLRHAGMGCITSGRRRPFFLDVGVAYDSKSTVWLSFFPAQIHTR